MPVLQYRCAICGFEFDELVKNHADPVYCPKCGGNAPRQWSGKVYSPSGKQKKSCCGNCSGCTGCK